MLLIIIYPQTILFQYKYQLNLSSRQASWPASAKVYLITTYPVR